MFAGDCVIYRKTTNFSDSRKLQDDLDSVSNWYIKRGTQLNTTECKSMRASFSSIPSDTFPYSIIGTALSVVNSYQYFVLYITNNLSWNTHAAYVTDNANRTLGYLRRNFSSAPSSLKLNLYKTLVRPKLEYVCAIWDPAHTNLLPSLESIQKRTPVLFSNYSRHSSVTSMIKTLDLPDISLRRKYSRLCLLHRIYCLNRSLKENLFTTPSYISRIDHQHKIEMPCCRANLYHSSFLPRTAIEWNRLPASICETTNFKIAVQSAL